MPEHYTFGLTYWGIKHDENGSREIERAEVVNSHLPYKDFRSLQREIKMVVDHRQELGDEKLAEKEEAQTPPKKK